MTTAPQHGAGATADHAPHLCNAALARAFGFLGKRWSGVILGTLMNGPLGFAELKRGVAGISDSMLADRLVELAGAGLVEREVCPGPPVSVRYHLSDSGMALLPSLHALTDWAEENLPERDCPAGE
jgi:DNA-binding HxlR family transcriptional regulator